MKRVVIVGTGFGGLSAARALAREPVEIVMIDRNNYHLFQPLLYQVATASLEQEAIAYPVRAITRDWENMHFMLSEVTGVDFEKRQVITRENGSVPYDYLILAAGAATSFFGMESVERHAFELKSLRSAVGLRNHILSIFEHVSRRLDPARRAAMLTFVIVGGGPTGIEFTGALAELVRQVMVKDYPYIHPDEVKIVLLEALDSLLPMLPSSKLQDYALKRLEGMGVQVRLGAKVIGAEDDRVLLEGGEEITTHTLLWAAGVKPVPLAETLDAPKARGGYIAVSPALTLPDHSEVFVIGDMAYLEQGGEPLPAMAPVAMQQGEYAASAILRRERGETVRPFHYRDKGTMAVIGRGSAVASISGLMFHGLPAWLVWLVVHIMYLVGFRNRLVVLLNWAYDYLFFDRKIRLITER
ncbi:MAG: NAD(P)/FAD-dependent oxidoreductase [Anaerolineae bacterium]|nr:NAD(P)/FAD-dependent oxidoreductase [Anaerolineae bacterium]